MNYYTFEFVTPQDQPVNLITTDTDRDYLHKFIELEYKSTYKHYGRTETLKTTGIILLQVDYNDILLLVDAYDIVDSIKKYKENNFVLYEITPNKFDFMLEEAEGDTLIDFDLIRKYTKVLLAGNLYLERVLFGSFKYR